jgi:putative redox protein
MAANSHSPPIVVTHEDGVRFAAQIRSHRIVVDQPREAGGEDAGPMPLELIATSLGTCVALYAKQFLGSRGLPYAGMRVEVGQRGASNPNRIAEFDIRVILPMPLPPGNAEMLDRVVRSCPAHHTLTHTPRVEIAIETASPVPA